MNILVCLKFIASMPDYQSKIFPFSPCEENALGMALSIKKKAAAGENSSVSVLCMGPPKAAKALQDIFCYGVDNIYLVSDDCYAGSDTLATTYVLADAVGKINSINNIELIICGKNTADSNTGQIGPGLAYRLGADFIDFLQDICLNEGYIVYETDRYKAKHSGKLVLAATAGRNFSLPFPTLNNILSAKNKKITVWNNDDLNLKSDCVGNMGSPTKIIKTVIKYPNSGKRIVVGGKFNDKVKFLNEIIKKENVN